MGMAAGNPYDGPVWQLWPQPLSLAELELQEGWRGPSPMFAVLDGNLQRRVLLEDPSSFEYTSTWTCTTTWLQLKKARDTDSPLMIFLVVVVTVAFLSFVSCCWQRSKGEWMIAERYRSKGPPSSDRHDQAADEETEPLSPKPLQKQAMKAWNRRPSAKDIMDIPPHLMKAAATHA